MAQYRSHTPDTIAYMEEYLDQFQRMKDIFLEFRVAKRTQAMVDKQRKEIRRQRALMRERVAISQRRPMRDEDRDEEDELRMCGYEGPIARERPIRERKKVYKGRKRLYILRMVACLSRISMAELII